MKITDADLDKILAAYDDPNLQQAAIEFVGYLKRFDKTKMMNISIRWKTLLTE